MVIFTINCPAPPVIDLAPPQHPRSTFSGATPVTSWTLTLHSHGVSASTLDGGRVWSLVLTRHHSDNSQSHTFLVLHERDWLASALGYLHKAIWLADASVGAWKVFNFCRDQRQWSDATDPQFSSATLDVTPFKVNERRWRLRPVWRGVTVHSHGASTSTLDGGCVWSLVLMHRHSDNSQSHTFLVLHERDWLASALGYLHKAIWLADASVGA